MPAFSDSVAIGIRATWSQAASTSSGEALALGADQHADLGLGHEISCHGGQPSSASASSAIVMPGSRAGVACATGTPKTAPMLARTALGLKGSALPGPSATQLAPKAAAERSTVPTLPGSPTPCR